MKSLALSLRPNLVLLTSASTAIGTLFAPLAASAAYYPSRHESQIIARLANSFQRFGHGFGGSAAQRQGFASDFLGLVNGTTKPSTASITQLTTDLTAALADSTLSTAEQQQLLLDVDAVLNSAGLSTAEAANYIARIQTLLANGGVSAARVRTLVSHLTRIAAGLQASSISTSTAFPLTASTSGAGTSGQAQLTTALESDGTKAAALSVEAFDLARGTYTVDAQTTGGNAVALGTLKVSASFGRNSVGAAVFGDSVGGPFTGFGPFFGGGFFQGPTKFPAGFDAAALSAVSITGASGVTKLSGTVAAATSAVRSGHFVLVPGTADAAAAGNVSFAATLQGTPGKTFFVLYAIRLPDSATLTLKANGVVVGTVVTSANGRLLIESGNTALPVKRDGLTPLVKPTALPAAVNVATLETLELDDAQGNAVATAGFNP